MIGVGDLIAAKVVLLTQSMRKLCSASALERVWLMKKLSVGERLRAFSVSSAEVCAVRFNHLLSLFWICQSVAVEVSGPGDGAEALACDGLCVPVGGGASLPQSGSACPWSPLGGSSLFAGWSYVCSSAMAMPCIGGMSTLVS